MQRGMGIVKVIVYMLLSIVTLFVVCLAQVGVYSALTSQTKDNEARIYFVSDASDENVSYIDAFRFWGTDLKTNFEHEPKYRVRNWLPWDWWKNSMVVLDYPVDVVVGAVKPIILPMTQVNEMNKYFDPESDMNSTSYYEWGLELVENERYQTIEDAIDDKKGAGYTELAVNEMLVRVANGDITFSAWVDEYDIVYTEIFRLIKYNQVDSAGKKIYADMYYKFINEDGDIKTAVYVMYFQIYISVILTIYILTQIPLAFDIGDEGEARVKGSIFTRRKRKRKSLKDRMKEKREMKK